jgi:trimeric autotransporter adhesin
MCTHTQRNQTGGAQRGNLHYCAGSGLLVYSWHSGVPLVLRVEGSGSTAAITGGFQLLPRAASADAGSRDFSPLQLAPPYASWLDWGWSTTADSAVSGSLLCVSQGPKGLGDRLVAMKTSTGGTAAASTTAGASSGSGSSDSWGYTASSTDAGAQLQVQMLQWTRKSTATTAAVAAASAQTQAQLAAAGASATAMAIQRQQAAGALANSYGGSAGTVVGSCVCLLSSSGTSDNAAGLADDGDADSDSCVDSSAAHSSAQQRSSIWPRYAVLIMYDNGSLQCYKPADAASSAVTTTTAAATASSTGATAAVESSSTDAAEVDAPGAAARAVQSAVDALVAAEAVQHRLQRQLAAANSDPVLDSSEDEDDRVYRYTYCGKTH